MIDYRTNDAWPKLDFEAMQDTIETLHQWLQIVGKVRLKTMPWQNHSWHTTLFVTVNGFSTQSIPYQGQIFQIDFDFRLHRLVLQSSNASPVSISLRPMTVASFYAELFDKLAEIGVDVQIHGSPNEVDPAIPFAENTVNKSYDPDAAQAIWQAMIRINEVFSRFRGEFVGKASPVQLFWGAFDLAISRFTGNPAPLHPGGAPNMPDEIMQESYSKEVASAGFWIGNRDFPRPLFYAYIYPSTEHFAKQPVKPAEAYYSDSMGEFILEYEAVRTASDPDQTLYEFLVSTYDAAAGTSSWDRPRLERGN
ncbi:DUF5996 family protein [Pontibacter sp. G13]|uniref:DUF5996 family protein n=1 Tax=Pontibacter sp. G13 TaxID=3074898 RepID=UPI0028893726|nr:DUF5996 family protein [Pontibacter sp. G13]WNJ17589.1 DUF5996 family protein [Pontibacter sp. G13]